MKLKLILILLTSLFPPAVSGREWSATYRPGTDEEKSVIWADRSRWFVLEGDGRPVRNTEGPMFILYRFDLGEATAARIQLEMLNNFLISASRDGQEWTEILRNEQFARGGSNYGFYEADLTPFLGGEAVFVKVQHSFPEEANGGFGVCIFQTILHGEDSRDLPAAVALRVTEPPVIDGRLEDDCWQKAQPLATFSERFGRGQAQSPTTAWLAYDEANFYVAYRCQSPHVGAFSASANRPARWRCCSRTGP